MNTKALSFAVIALALTAGSGEAAAQEQVVSFEVEAITKMTVSGTPSLVISDGVAGADPTDATASGTWAITTNEHGRKVTASIDQNMPEGVKLLVSLIAPTGAISAGSPVELTTAATDVVTGIVPVSESGMAINYTLKATAEAGVVAASQRTVTYTVVAGA